MSFWDSRTAPVLVSIDMEMTPEVQAYVAAQEAELSGLKQEFLGVSLDHAAAQKRLKGEKASAEAALAAERTPLCQGSCPLLYLSLLFRWAD